MTTQAEDPIRDVAEQVANSLGYRGYAFIEDDKVEPLTATLRAFLQTAGTPINIVGDSGSGISPGDSRAA